MNRLRILSCLCALLLGGFKTAQAMAPDAPEITQAELVRRTQQLYDALVPGDQAPWKTYYADDAMVYDEKGRTMDKKAFLADLQPMPAGYSGSIKVIHPHTNLASPSLRMTARRSRQSSRTRYTRVWIYRAGSLYSWLPFVGNYRTFVTNSAHLLRDFATVG